MSTQTDTAPLLAVDELQTWFDTPGGKVHAVDGVSFTLHRGQTLGVVGESGSGKSILSRSIMNILPRRNTLRAGGRVLFQGRDIYHLTSKDMRPLWGPELAMIFQDPMTALNPVLRVGEQIMESLRLHMDLSRAEARTRAIELLQSVGIPAADKRIDVYPHQLSGGMRQRVIIAIALACSPSLLIADEPTTALDVTVQKQILDLLAEQQQQRNMGMILVTHDLGVVASRTDAIAVMYAGQFVEYAPTKTLFRNMKHPYTEALLNSIPRLRYPAHSRLQAIPGRPPQLIDPAPGCRFAPRCRYAQPRCLSEDPSISSADGSHSYMCFYPVGTEAGQQALADNVKAGQSASGIPVTEIREAG